MLFFKKRKKEGGIDQIHLSLKNSFSNIKEDIKHLHNKHEDHHDRLKALEEKFFLLESKLSSIQKPISKEESIEDIEEGNEVGEALTDLQFDLLKGTAALLEISNKDWVTLQAIAKEFYPEKKYETIRSLLSNYTTILTNLGLLEKQRKGRKTALRLTEKGKEQLPKHFYSNLRIKVRQQEELSEEQ